MPEATVGPLSGLKVIEISMYIQGPVAGLVLSSLGADVIKIEQIGRGEPFRSLTSFYSVDLDGCPGWAFAAVNRGKRTLPLDIEIGAGREIFSDLISRADVFLTNLRPNSIKKMGADYETLKGINPQLIYGMSNGLGFAGPYASDPVQDTVGSAYAGFMDLTSETLVPTYPPGSMSDVLAGSSLASAVLAGLVRRSLTGRGSLVRTSQLQSLLWLEMMPVGLLGSSGNRVSRFVPAANPFLAPYETSDGWIAIAAIHPDQWAPLAQALGLPSLLADPRFSDFQTAMKNGIELVPVFQERFRESSTFEWWSTFRNAGVWAAPVHRLEDLLDDQQVIDNEYLRSYSDGLVAPPVPFDVDGWTGAGDANASAYGEDTDDILAGLGLSEERVAHLRVAGVVW